MRGRVLIAGLVAALLSACAPVKTTEFRASPYWERCVLHYDHGADELFTWVSFLRLEDGKYVVTRTTRARDPLKYEEWLKDGHCGDIVREWPKSEERYDL